jgi:hypothetical protein
MSFVGPTICYSFMQAAGVVNDHTVDCHCYQQIVDSYSAQQQQQQQQQQQGAEGGTAAASARGGAGEATKQRGRAGRSNA